MLVGLLVMGVLLLVVPFGTGGTITSDAPSDLLSLLTFLLGWRPIVFFSLSSWRFFQYSLALVAAVVLLVVVSVATQAVARTHLIP
jgi:hypothetical protein